MKQVAKRLLLLTLVVTLLIPSSAFAGSKPNINEVSIEKELSYRSKLSPDLSEGKLSDDERVRIIVELYDSPLIETATAAGKEVEELSDSLVERRTEIMTEDQEAVIKAVTSEAKDVEVHSQFVNVYNGISMTVDVGDLEAIAQNELVKSVSLSNVYSRPEPAMTNSSFFTKSNYVNQDLGYTGEGMVVAIIDTGIDPSHKDFILDEGVVPGLTETEVDEVLDFEGNPLPGKYYTEKVPYGYNYMDESDEIRDLGPEASMHGMHVAGTVSANGEIKGVAPNSQVLAMKVFGNDPDFQSTFGDTIIAAIDDAIALGADVMNLSLGSTAAFVDETDPEQMAITRAVDNGIVMSISAGNSSYAGDGVYGSLDLVFAENPDVGVVGSPGLTAESLQVASINNFTYLYETSVSVEGSNMTFEGYGKDEWDVEDTYELMAIGGTKLGGESDYEGLDVSGKIVLVSRGDYSFYDKTRIAASMGAAGIIVYDHEESQFYYDQGGWDIPFMMIHKAEGLELEELLAEKGTLTLSMFYDDDGKYVDPVTGQISSFSSWGTTPDLGFKPEIAAPGGNIYSTLNDDSYGYMSGTSMAAPHVSGGAALMLERIQEMGSVFAGVDLNSEEGSLLAKNILMNTATPVEGIDNESFMTAIGLDGVSVGDYYGYGLGYASPRQQGAGSMNLAGAMTTEVVVTEAETGIAKVNLGELKDNTLSFDLKLKNYGKAYAPFRLDSNMQIMASIIGYNTMVPVNVPMEVTYTYLGESYESMDMITLDPESEEILTVSMTMDETEYAYALSNNPNGFFLEGYVCLYSDDEVLYKAMMAAYGNREAKALEIQAQEAAITTQEAMVLSLEQEVDVLETTASAIYLEIESYDDGYEAYLDKLESIDEAELAVSLAQDDVAGIEESLAILYGNNSDVQMVQNYIDYLKDTIEATESTIDEFESLYKECKAMRDSFSEGSHMWQKYNRDLYLIDRQLDYTKDVLDELNEELKAVEEILSQEQIDLISSVMERLEVGLTEAREVLETKEAVLEEANSAVTADDMAMIEALESLIANYRAACEAVEVKAAELIEAQAVLGEMNETLQELKDAYEALDDNAIDAEDAYFNSLPLSVPYTGFAGDWSDAAGFDGTIYQDDGTYSFYEMTALLDEQDDFLGYNEADKSYYAACTAISPNGDGYRDGVVPLYSLMRNMEDLTYEVRDEDGNVVTLLGELDRENKTYYDSGNSVSYKYHPEYVWYGTVGYEILKDGSIKETMAEDGLYTYVITGNIVDANQGDSQAELTKELSMSFMIDTVAPEIEGISYSNGDEVLIADVSDEGSGISYCAMVDLSTGNVIAKSYDGNFDLTPIIDDVYAVTIYVEDYAGNDVFSSAMVINDDDIPEVSIDVEPYGIYTDKTVTTYGSYHDVTMTNVTINGNPVEFAYEINDMDSTLGHAADNEFVYSETFEEDGAKEFVVEAVDYVGNDYGFARKFYVDSAAPAIVSAKDDLDDIVYVSSDTESYDVTLTVSENFPNMVVKADNSVVFTSNVDFISYEDLLKPVEYTYEKTLDLEEGANSLYIEATDEAGNSTFEAMTVYRLAEGEVNPNKVVTEVNILNGDARKIIKGQSFELELEYVLADGTVLNAYDGAQISAASDGIVTIDGTTVKGTGTGKVVLTVAADQAAAEITVTVAPSNSSPSGGGSSNKGGDNNDSSNGDANTDIGDEAIAQANPTLISSAYIDGYPDGTFNPDGLIKRSEISKILNSVINLVEGEPAEFSDVSDGYWAKSYIDSLQNAKLIVGYEDGSFQPEATITRAEMAAILSRIIDYAGLEVADTTANYTDIADHWASTYIQKIYAYGIEIEDGATLFMPDEQLTRAEAVVMINELLKLETTEGAEMSYTDVPEGHWAYEALKAAAK